MTSLKPIDTQDLKYQVSSDFKPDKESTYPTSMAEDGWMHAHNAIRAEINGMKNVLEKMILRGDGGSLPEWTVNALQKWWEGHSEIIHGHHSNEDDILNPELRTRFNYPDKLESDHKILIEKMDDVGEAIKKLKAGDSIILLHEKWIVYANTILPHLIEEEVIGLPLARAYFSATEMAAITEKIMQSCSALEMGSFIYHMGEDHFRNSFMKEHGIPWFVWWIQLRGNFAFYQSNMAAHMAALETGVKPELGSNYLRNQFVFKLLPFVVVLFSMYVRNRDFLL